jgi:uncharacterized membrane protein YkoI
MNPKKIVVAALAVLALGGAATAFAKESRNGKETDEVKAYEEVTIKLAKAIETAESETHGGKAVEAKLEQEHGKVAFEVEILKDGAFRRVVIDARTGQILKSDLADHGDDEEDGEHDDD